MWIVELFFENRLEWQFEVRGKILQNALYLHTHKILVHNSLHVFENWGAKFKS